MENIEKTLVLVKPDGVAEGHIGEIITRFEQKQYNIIALKVIKATTEQLKRHYIEQISQPFFNEIKTYMQEGSIVAIVVSGPNVVENIHNMAGATKPVESKPGTIRGDFARIYPDGILRNIIHTSDNRDNAINEIAIWFPEMGFHQTSDKFLNEEKNSNN